MEDKVQRPNNRLLMDWNTFFILTSLEGFAAIFITALLPGEAGKGFLGLSPFRWILLSAMGVFLLLNLFLFIKTRHSPLSNWSPCSFHWSKILILAALGAAFLILTFILLLVRLHKGTGIFSYKAYLYRLLPALLWGLLVALQSIPLLYRAKWKLNQQFVKTERTFLVFSLIILCVLLLVWVVIAFTGFGITPDVVGWGKPFVPLVGWQILLSFLVGFGLWKVSAWTERMSEGHPIRAVISFLKKEWLILTFLWVLASSIWLSQPVPASFFATQGRPPNYEIYPFSDGLFYAKYAQTLLIGSGFHTNHIPPRPLYILLLAGFTALANQDYSLTITFQTLLLAFIPPLLYLLGKQLFNRSAGFAIALLMILREFTSIVTSPYTLNASNSKLFFSELPVLLTILLFLFFAVKWLQNPDKALYAPLLAGGFMGTAMLIRTQSIFILVPVLVIAGIQYCKKWKKLIKPLLLLFLALSITISPWLMRNESITGEWVFDHPDSQLGSMAARYSPSGEERLQRLPGETEADFNARLKQQIREYIYENPWEVARFIFSHFLNNEVSGFFSLPARASLLSPLDFFIPQTAYWQIETLSSAPLQILLRLFYLLMISIGLSATWRRWQWVGWIPLFANLSYNFSNSLARNSGDRYLLPVDWVFYFYFTIGVFQTGEFILAMLGWVKQNSSAQSQFMLPYSEKRYKPAIILLLLLFFAGIGTSLPLSEVLIPERYPDKSENEITSLLFETRGFEEIGINQDEILNFLVQENAVIFFGRAIYPRFYPAGEGEPLSDKTGFRILDYPRMVFFIIDNDSSLAILNMSESPPYFPHASDSIVLGCNEGNYVQVKAAAILSGEEHFYIADNFYPLVCQDSQ